MKTLEEIAQDYNKPKCMDGRDITRLAAFIPEAQLKDFGMELEEDHIGKHIHIELTKENVLQFLKDDVEFGFKKALNQRGLSASMMNDVVKMWNWVLQDGLEDFSDDKYSMYGLPLLKATAVKYGFPNPIGENEGSEVEYDEN